MGPPNAGKSTLLNQMLDFRLSIVTTKPQTTRKNVLGILNGTDYQIIFIDTPGLIVPKYALQSMLMKYIEKSLQDTDVIVYLVDVTSGLNSSRIELLKVKKPVILALNKIDLIYNRKILPLIDQYRKIFNFSTYIPISALKKDGLEDLLKEIIHKLPVHPPFFPQDSLTDESERFFVSEIIREKIFELYDQEIPYACHVSIEEFTEKKGAKDYIRTVIFVDQLSQKGILIGKNGRALRKVGELARRDIEKFLGRPVYLELYVKVISNWRRNSSKLKSLGY
jgi:GTP-binding protein Era